MYYFMALRNLAFIILLLATLELKANDTNKELFNLIKEDNLMELTRALYAYYHISYDQADKESRIKARTTLKKLKKKELYNKHGETLLFYAVRRHNMAAVKQLVALGFDVNECNDNKKIFSRTKSIYSPRVFTSSRTPRGSESPRQRSNLTISVSRCMNTPLTALLDKDASLQGLAIARFLIQNKADINKAINIEQKNSIERLTNNITFLAQIQPSMEMPSKILEQKLERNLIKFSDDPMLRPQIQHRLRSFSYGKVTARVVSERGKHLNGLESILTSLVNWEGDVELPPPQDALATYYNIKNKLDDGQKFIMLYDYLQKYHWMLSQKRNEIYNEPCLTNESFLQLSPHDVARTIYEMNLKNFIATPADCFGAHCITKQTARNLATLLSLLEKLPGFVSYTIISAKHPKKVTKFWMSVYTELFELGDFHGVHCISAGFHKIEDYIAPKGIVNFGFRKDYANAIQERKGRPYIPAIAKETGEFIGRSEAWQISDYVDQDSSFSLNTFEKSIAKLQQQFGKALSIQPKRNIEDFLTNLDTDYGKRASFLMIGTFQKVPNTQVENWDDLALRGWINQYGFKFKQLRELTQMGIYDGPSLLESYVFMRSRQETLPLILQKYQDFCKEHSIHPLANRKKSPIFQDELLLHPDSSFHWIMWLRNKNLRTSIIPLFKQNIINLRSFVEAKNGVTFFNFLKEKAQQKLTELYSLYERSKELKKDLTTWTYLDIEAWLFAHGLEHLEPVVRKSTRKKPNRFFALLYFLKIDKPADALKHVPWLGIVMNDRFEEEYNIVSFAEKYGSQKFSKRLLDDAFYFISIFKELQIKPHYIRFFMAGINTFKDFINLSNEQLGNYALADIAPTLEKFLHNNGVEITRD